LKLPYVSRNAVLAPLCDLPVSKRKLEKRRENRQNKRARQAVKRRYSPARQLARHMQCG
jgi:hypothetical protein